MFLVKSSRSSLSLSGSNGTTRSKSGACLCNNSIRFMTPPFFQFTKKCASAENKFFKLICLEFSYTSSFDAAAWFTIYSEFHPRHDPVADRGPAVCPQIRSAREYRAARQFFPGHYLPVNSSPTTACAQKSHPPVPCRW